VILKASSLVRLDAEGLGTRSGRKGVFLVKKRV